MGASTRTPHYRPPRASLREDDEAVSRYSDSLRSAVAACGAPYGYTLSVWTSGALLISAHGLTNLAHALSFMVGSVAGYALVGTLAFGEPRRPRRRRGTRSGVVGECACPLHRRRHPRFVSRLPLPRRKPRVARDGICRHRLVSPSSGGGVRPRHPEREVMRASSMKTGNGKSGRMGRRSPNRRSIRSSPARSRRVGR